MAFPGVKISTRRNGGGSVTGYREDLASGDTVAAALTSTLGVSTFLWQLVGRPEGSAAGGTGPEPILLGTGSTCSFVVDDDSAFRRDGTYLLQCTVNAGTPTETRIRVILARLSGLVLPGSRALRKPSGFEADDDSSVANTDQGWATQLNRWLEYVRTAAFAGGGASPVLTYLTKANETAGLPNSIGLSTLGGPGLLKFAADGTPSKATVGDGADYLQQAYTTFEAAGTPVTKRYIVSFSSAFTVVDNAGATRTDVGLAANAITAALFRQSAALSVVGNPTGSTANVQDIVASADGQVLQRAGGALVWAAVPAGAVAGVPNTVPFFNGAGALTESTAALGYDPSTNRLGSRVSTGLPLYQVHLVDEAGASDRGITVAEHNDTPSFTSGLRFRRSRGTYAGPTIVANTDYGAGPISWEMYDGTTYLPTAMLGAHVRLGTTPAAGLVGTEVWLDAARNGVSDPYGSTGTPVAMRVLNASTAALGSRQLVINTNPVSTPNPAGTLYVQSTLNPTSIVVANPLAMTGGGHGANGMQWSYNGVPAQRWFVNLAGTGDVIFAGPDATVGGGAVGAWTFESFSGGSGAVGLATIGGYGMTIGGNRGQGSTIGVLDIYSRNLIGSASPDVNNTAIALLGSYDQKIIKANDPFGTPGSGALYLEQQTPGKPLILSSPDRGSSGSTIEVRKGGTAVTTWESFYGGVTFTSFASTSTDNPIAATYLGAAHTRVGNNEQTDVLYALDRTVNFGGGDALIPFVRAVRFKAPTYTATASQFAGPVAVVGIDAPQPLGANFHTAQLLSLYLGGNARIDGLGTGYVKNVNGQPLSVSATIPAADITGIFYQQMRSGGVNLGQVGTLNADGTVIMYNDLSSAFTDIGLPNVGPGAGTYGGSGISRIQLDAQGRVTNILTATYLTSIAGISAGGDLTGTYPNPTIATNVVSNAKLRQSSGLSVLGNATNATANVSDITSTVAGQVLQNVGGTSIGWAALPYSALTGTPTLFYQTVRNGAGVALTQRTELKFSADFLVTDASPATLVALVSQGGLTAGSYTNVNLTVNAAGVVTAVSNGTAGLPAVPPLFVTAGPSPTLTIQGAIVTGSTSTSAVNLGALPNGLLRITVSSGVATLSSDTTTYQPALSLTNRSVLVSGGGSTVVEDNANFQYNTSSHALTVNHVVVPGSDGSGVAISLSQAGAQSILKSTGLLTVGTSDANGLSLVANGASLLALDPSGLVKLVGFPAGILKTDASGFIHTTNIGWGLDYINVAYQTVQNGGTPLTQRSTLNMSTGLTAVDNSGSVRTDVTANLSTGIAGGQTAKGGTGAGESLHLSSTTNATKGLVISDDELVMPDGAGTSGSPGHAHASDTTSGWYRYLDSSYSGTAWRVGTNPMVSIGRSPSTNGAVVRFLSNSPNYISFTGAGAPSVNTAIGTDWANGHLFLNAAGGGGQTVVGMSSDATGAMATSATRGFLAVAGMPGAPSGIPVLTGASGAVPLAVDTADFRLYTYLSGLGVWLPMGQYHNFNGIVQSSGGLDSVVTIGSGLTFSGGTLSATATAFYQTVHYNSVDLPQAAKLGFSNNFALSNGAGITNVDLSTTGVTANTYTNATITVGADGRITAASNGSAGSAFYQTIVAAGIPLPQHNVTNFFGGLTAADDSASGRTSVTADLSTGKSGGQAVMGGVSGGEALTIVSNPIHNGKIFIGNAGSVGVFDEGTGKTSLGQTSVDAHMHVVMPNDAGNGATAAWNDSFAVFGLSGANGTALGVSTTSSTSVNLSALSPGVAWRNLRINANSVVIYSGGSTPGFFQDTSGNIGATTLAAGGVVTADPGTGQLRASGAVPAASSLNYMVSFALSGAGTPGGWYATSSATPGAGFLAGAFKFEYPLSVAASSATLRVLVLLNGTSSDSFLIQITRNGTAIGSGVTVDNTVTAGTVLTYTVSIAGGVTSDVYGVKHLGSGADVSGNVVLDVSAVFIQ